MLNEKVKALLNDQVNKEMYSAYLYLDFSGFFGGKGLGGFAAWYMKQAKEEMEHAFKIYDYIHANGEAVELLAINKPNVALTDELQVLNGDPNVPKNPCNILTPEGYDDRGLLDF